MLKLDINLLWTVVNVLIMYAWGQGNIPVV